MENKIKLFENKVVRSHWDAEQEEWYFSVVDVIEVLTESKDAKQYLKKMRSRDLELNSNWGTICTLVKMVGKDGKLREIQAANTAGILRLIQSIPSPKAEPFKLWLAQVGSERLDEIADPEKAILRGADFYRAKGYTENWINQRLQTIEMRKELTDEWKARGINKEKDYAILTNEMTKAWSGLSVKDYRELKEVTTIQENIQFYPTDHCGVLRVNTNEIETKYLAWVLNQKGIEIGFKRSYRASIDRVASLTVNLPPLAEQQKIVDQIIALEEQIAAAKKIIADIPARKQAILDKWL